jgi:hypothetical protein
MVRVACIHHVKPLGQCREVVYYILRWHEPVLILEDPSEGWYMYVYDLHMSCGKETPAGPNQFKSSCSSIMETWPSDHST